MKVQEFKIGQYIRTINGIGCIEHIRQSDLRVRFDYGTYGVLKVNVLDILPEKEYPEYYL